MSKEISRRQFLENIGLGTAAGTSLLLLKDVANARPAADAIPSRTLGRTGDKVSILERRSDSEIGNTISTYIAESYKGLPEARCRIFRKRPKQRL